MNGQAHLAEIAQNLERLAEALYGLPRDAIEVPIREINDALRDLGDGDVEQLLQQMRQTGLVQILLAGDVIRLNAAGKLAHSSRCTSELVLGEQFIGSKYRNSVVHIIVRNELGDESGGTGFFVSEPENRIVTAGHIFDGHRLVRIEDISGNIVADGEVDIQIAGGRLDLATIRCDQPAGVTPFRIAWGDNTVSELERILIFGYPPFAGHNVALVSASTQIIALAPLTGEPGKHSLIVPRLAAPGCSGGPVVNKAGLVVGVVSRDNILERAHPPQFTTYISATPASYLQELPGIRDL